MVGISPIGIGTSQSFVSSGEPRATENTATASVSSRPAAGIAPAITTDLRSVGRTSSEISGAFRQQLDNVFSVLIRDPDSRNATVDQALTSLAPLIESAGAPDVTAFQIRIGSLESRISGGGEFAGVGALREFVLDVGLVRFGRVSGADASVLTLTGGRLALSSEEIQTGLGTGQFSRDLNVPAPNTPSPRLTEAREALDRVRATRDALETFRASIRESSGEAGGLFGGRAAALSAFVDIFA